MTALPASSAGVPALPQVPPVARWPRAAVLSLLGAVAVGLALVETVWPAAAAHSAPAVLSVASLAMGVLVARHAQRLDPESAAPWRAFAVIAGLLTLGQAIAAVRGVGVNPATAGPQDVPLVVAVPFALLGCARLIRSAATGIGSRVALDAAVGLVGLSALAEMVISAALGRTVDSVDDLVAWGYPAAGVVLCTVGLVTFARVSQARRAAAGWLLACFASVAVVTVSGAIAVVRPSVVTDVVTGTAWLAMLGFGTLAIAADPGRSTDPDEPPEVPLLGVVVSYCAAFGVVLVLLVGRIAGRSILPVEAAAAALLLLLTFARTLVWAADGARLTRQVLRTEAYFRTLVHSAADITIVLDHHGRITWDSGAGRHAHGWSARELEGRLLTDFVHVEDRDELLAALAAGADPDGDQGQGRTFRLRSRDGRWPFYETVRVVTSGDLHRPADGAPAPGGAGLVVHLRDADTRRHSELELERMAYTDYLTGLPNRARLMAALAGARSRASEGEASCLLLLDLDGFKAVNDIAGHEAGDLLLTEVADRLRATVRDRDVVGRLGGDEFAVLVRADLDEATALGERIIAELAGVHRSVPTPGADPDLVFDVSCSIGVTELASAEEVAATIRHADLALRAAKAAGKGRVRRHGETADSATVRRTRLARDLPDALSRGQLRLVYQPVVGVAERRVLGIEALVRWDHPVLGEVSPEEFVPLAEDDGLIVPLQRWVLDQATAELAALLRAGRDLQLGVNISVRHLQSGSLVPDVAAALARAGLPPQRLMLEVTESLFIGQPDRADGDLQTLHDMGCVISLDDFGRGYSTFAYLARLPVDVLKMDREFLAGLTDDARCAASWESVIELGNRLSIDVVAEGVETPGQLAALRDLGCRYLQGFLLGRPTGPAELAAVIDAFDPASLDVVGAQPAAAVPGTA
ncbi:putative bifunctional diguanylate cyclase/phosphodiesterase [Modestobacter marinus]|uniref:putative bifunctional diguanylate cyclase/phosphodiesterase n=1 Tax=Modestobacter marinus TaxID=477641 RepID=UPI00201B0527|nr:bifunctional diguanylate cyclase/phosphodiesterase [Modestobacter marinus]